MLRSESLQRMLSDITAVYNDNRRLAVEYANVPCAIDEDTVAVAPNVREALGRTLSGPDELRVVVNSLSHEVEHVRESDLRGKKAFMARYPDTPQAAGAIRNIVEDAFIDKSRCERFPGMRKAMAFVTDALMENPYRRPTLDKLDHKAEQCIEGLVQLGNAGYVKGIDKAEPEVQNFLAWARPELSRARYVDDYEKRERLAEGIVDEYLRIVSDPEEQSPGEDYVEDGLGGGTDQPPKMHETEVDSENGGSQGTAARRERNAETASSPAQSATRDWSADIEEMAELAEGKESRDWHGVAEDEDYTEADRDWQDRYERLQRKIEEEGSALGKRLRERAQRKDEIEDMPDWQRGLTGEEVKAALDDSGLAGEIETAFRELKTRDRDVNVRRGPRLDIRSAIRYTAGDYGEDRLYLRTENAEIGDRAVAVALDLSGSMDIGAAKKALGALYLATEAIGDDFMASGFTTNGGSRIQLPLITSPDEEFDWEHLDSVRPGDLTPTSAGIRDAYNLLQHASKREKVVVCITDGMPNITEDSMRTSRALRESAETVRDIRASGVKVIGLGVDCQDDLMRNIFGQNGYVTTDMSNLAERLVEVYRSLMKTA